MCEVFEVLYTNYTITPNSFLVKCDRRQINEVSIVLAIVVFAAVVGAEMSVTRDKWRHRYNYSY